MKMLPTIELKKNTFTSVTRNQFVNELSKSTFLSNCKDSVNEPYDEDEEDENEYQIYLDNLTENDILKFSALNLLVIGNIKATWVNTENNEELGYDEGGSLFVMGSIDCDYFNSYYGKLIVIEDSLKAHKILNNAFQDSALLVKNDLSTEYFYGQDIWAEVGGNASIKYGEGYCLPLEYLDASKQQIEPKHNEVESIAFLGLNPNDDEDYDEDDINQLIESRINNLK